MSFLISQDDEPDSNPTPHFHTYPLKRILTNVGIFESNYHLIANAQSLIVHRILDINHKYKFRVDIKAHKDSLLLSSILFKNSQLLTIRDTSTRVIYYRLVQKYFTKSSLNIYLTTCGNFATKKALLYQHLDSALSYSLRRDNLRRDNCEQVKATLLEFIQQSALFYKTLIHKLGGNVGEIARLRPNYQKRQFLATNLCNYSCFPTLDMYRKELQASSQSIDLHSRYTHQNPSSTHLSKSFSSHRTLYSPHISSTNHNWPKQSTSTSQHNNNSLDSSFILPNSQLNIQQIYNKLLQRQEKCRQKFVQTEISKSHQTDIDLLYKTFVGNLDVVFAKRESKQNKIYNPVHIITPELVKWDPFQFTSLSELKIGKIKYVYAQQKVNKQKQSVSHKNSSKPNSYKSPNYQLHMQQSYQTTVILKHQPQKLLQINQKPSQMSQQLKWQKTIIQECFKNSYCIYMTRFFAPHQPSKIFTHINLKNNSFQPTCILSEYIRRGTLHKWMYESGCTNSIFTKINVILYVLYGVMFLHSKKVFHMDIKPQNILIDKNLVPKIADFGSAYNKEVYQKMRKQKIHYYLSFSIPYTAPQIFMRSHKPQINAKCDVFSIGLILYEIFFNKCIFGGVNSDRLDRVYREIGVRLDEWEQRRLKSGMRQFVEVPQQLLLSGIYLCPQAHETQQSSIYHLLMNLITRCLSCNQHKRPNLGMLVIALKQIFQMTVQYYAW